MRTILKVTIEIINYFKLKQTRCLNSGWVQTRALFLKNAYSAIYGLRRIAIRIRHNYVSFLSKYLPMVATRKVVYITHCPTIFLLL
jgi:hypothetical protein